MATISAIARPYGKAAYEFGLEKNDLAAWNAMLQTASTVLQTPALSKLLSSGRLSPEQWFALLCDLLKPNLNEERKNFLKLVADNKRVAALPEIAQVFKDYEILNKQATDVEVITAVPLEATQQEKLAEKLGKLLHYKVNLRCKIDETILGGALVRAGDKVFDGTVSGQLSRLLEFAIR